MDSFNGQFQEWSGGPEQEVSVMVLDTYVQIGFTGTNQRLRWTITDLNLDVSADGTQTEIRHQRTPGLVCIVGRFAYDRIRARQSLTQLPWSRRPRVREWLRNGGLLIGVIALFLFLYSLMVPWMAEKMASVVSVETEQQLGDGVYEALASDYQTDTARTRLVNAFFESMKVSSAYSIRLVVVKSEELNAFALPGGRIVVYSALLDRMEGAPELAALLAHEFTHVDRRHATRSIFRRLGSQVFLGLVFGKFGTVRSVLVGHADELRALTYSRSLEEEADQRGLKILTNRGIDARGFLDLFERLKSSSSLELPEFLASHPDLDNRIAYIKESSKGAKAKPQPALDAIFAQLKP
jgi:Zn-dependent protease with chaperone function